MSSKTSSEGYKRFQSAMEFSMELNTRLWPGVRRIAGVSHHAGNRLLSLFHTFGVLTAVWAFECFLTERCMERDLASGCQKGLEYWQGRKWREKLKYLRPEDLTCEAWERTLERYTPDIYFKTRNLWCHGVGMADAVKPENQPDASEVSTMPDPLDPQSTLDAANYYKDTEGRLWAKRKLWGGCVNALKALVEKCW